MRQFGETLGLVERENVGLGVEIELHKVGLLHCELRADFALLQRLLVERLAGDIADSATDFVYHAVLVFRHKRNLKI